MKQIEKINVHVSLREKSTCNKFHEEEIKIQQVSRRHKSKYIKFLEDIIHMQQVSLAKISMHHVSRRHICQKFYEEKHHVELSFAKE